MAYFAKVVEGRVERVCRVEDADCGHEEYPASDSIGAQHMNDCGFPGTWLQTSKDNQFRGVFAGAGYTYNSETDTFNKE